MRTRLFLVAVVVALVAPVGAVWAAQPARASTVSTRASWTDNWSGWDRSSSPTIADVNGDGRPEIVIGHQNGLVHVINGANGRDISGWPQQAGAAVDSTPAVGDLFKNGKKEIVVGIGSTWVRNQQGGLVVFNADGTRHCEFRTLDDGNVWANTGTPDGYTEPVFSSPAIGDINGDGYPDIVFGSFDSHIYAIDRNCNKIMDYYVEDSVWSSPALYDLYGDGRMEIFIGSDQSPGGIHNGTGGTFRAMRWSSSAPGNAQVVWEHRTNDTVWSSPALGDIVGDGRLVVVVGGGGFFNRDDGRKVFAFHADDGSLLPGWPVATAGYTMSSPALGDVTGDGVPEVAIGSADGSARVFRGNGQLLWGNHLPFNNQSPGGPITASPIIADLNGDGRNDVGIGNDWGFFVLDGSSGRILAEPDAWSSHESAGAVGDFGKGVGWRLVVDGFNTPGHRNVLQAFPMPTPRTSAPWPMFRRDPLHHAGPVALKLLPVGQCRSGQNPASHPIAASSKGYWVLGADGAVFSLHGAPFYGSASGKVQGTAVAIAATHSGHGYYVLDNSGDIFLFGDARSFGSMAGRHLNAPIIALAPTPSGRGYWLLASDGGVFSFGDARFYGSMGATRLNKPVISMAATNRGHGYWLLASDGGVFSFGDASFHGSTGNIRLNSPVISMATAASGKGYWLVAGDGGIFSFGVPFYGSVPGIGLCSSAPGTQIRPTLTGHGYFVLGSDGRIFAFGDALSGGSAPPLGGWSFATDLAVRP